MATLEQAIHSLDDVAPTRALRARGFSDHLIAKAIRSGSIYRVRNGWVALSTAAPETATAVRVGGGLSCVSALRRAGVWLPHDERIHVAVHSNASRLRPAQGTVIHWTRPVGAAAAVDGVAQSLIQAAGCLAPEFALVALDSALNKRLASTGELSSAFAHAPARAQHLLALADEGSQSGLETLARYRLRRWRVGLRTQVVIPGVGRVDVLIGDRLVLELDGRGFHDETGSFEEDRRRDLELHRLGYIVVRLSYRQVMEQWPRAESVLLTMIRRGDHFWPRSRA